MWDLCVTILGFQIGRALENVHGNKEEGEAEKKLLEMAKDPWFLIADIQTRRSTKNW